MVQGRKSSPKSSQYKGVYWDKNARKWAALIYIHGVPQYDQKKEHIGLYQNEADAAHAYDARAREEWGSSAETNFNELGVRNEGVGTQTSKYTGVHWHKQAGKWRARIQPPNGKQQKYLGLFVNEEAAARKYDDASAYHGLGRPNFPALRPYGLTDAEYLAAQGGIDDADDLPRLKRRRRAARDEENDVEVARLTVYIIFAKKMLKVAEKMIKTADPKRRARRQADLLGLWLDRDAALEDPVEWVRLRARARGRSGS